MHTATTPATEMVVLCAEDGTTAGVMAKADVHTADTALHLAFSVYLFDGDGRLLVTRRALSKFTFPGIRTNSCCGHPAPGEAMTDAIVRRSGYELGVTPTDLDLILPAFRYRAVAADGTVENELCPVYRGFVDPAQVRPEPDEVAQAWWTPWPDFAHDDADPLSIWSQEQARQLNQLGSDPLRWPAADPRLLPAAATQRG